MNVNDNCLCTIAQTGWDSCAEENPLIVALILMKLRDSDGNKNYIDLALPIDQALADASINNEDLDKRFFYIDDLEEVVHLPKERRTFTTKSDTEFKIDKTKPFQFNAVRYDMPMTVIGALDSAFCQGYGVIYILADGSMIVSSEEEGKAYPRAIQDGTISFTTGNDKGGATKNNGIMDWTEKKTETLAKYQIITPDAGFIDSLVKVKELKSSIVTNASIGSALLNIDLYHGRYNAPIHYVKSKVSQFSIIKDSDSSVIPVTTVSVDVDCNTVLEYDPTGLITGDTLTVTVSANGYYLSSFKIVMP